ncbi:MAG: hypothetical protein QM679_05165 [Patulibacter sp.]
MSRRYGGLGARRSTRSAGWELAGKGAAAWLGGTLMVELFGLRDASLLNPLAAIAALLVVGGFLATAIGIYRAVTSSPAVAPDGVRETRYRQVGQSEPGAARRAQTVCIDQRGPAATTTIARGADSRGAGPTAQSDAPGQGPADMDAAPGATTVVHDHRQDAADALDDAIARHKRGQAAERYVQKILDGVRRSHGAKVVDGLVLTRELAGCHLGDADFIVTSPDGTRRAVIEVKTTAPWLTINGERASRRFERQARRNAAAVAGASQAEVHGFLVYVDPVRSPGMPAANKLKRLPPRQAGDRQPPVTSLGAAHLKARLVAWLG